MKLTGAKILLESLKREGVDVIFGYPGAAITDIHDQMEGSKIEHILVRHEQAAVHAADAYARATGKVGVVLVHFRTGRDQHRHRPGHGVHGFQPR